MHCKVSIVQRSTVKPVRTLLMFLKIGYLSFGTSRFVLFYLLGSFIFFFLFVVFSFLFLTFCCSFIGLRIFINLLFVFLLLLFFLFSCCFFGSSYLIFFGIFLAALLDGLLGRIVE